MTSSGYIELFIFFYYSLLSYSYNFLDIVNSFLSSAKWRNTSKDKIIVATIAIHGRWGIIIFRYNIIYLILI